MLEKSVTDQDARERLRQIEKFGRIASWEWRVAEDRVIWSDETAALYGIERAPTRFGEFIALVHPEDRARVRAEAKEYLARGGPFEHEFRIVDRQGRVRWILDRGESVLGPDGQPRSMFGINIDLTAQRQAEAALRQSEDRFRAIFDSAAVGIASVTTDGRLLMVNDRMCDILGYPRQELLGIPFTRLIEPEHREAYLAQVRAMLDGEISAFSIESRYLSEGHQEIWGNLTVGCLRDESGAVDFLVSVLADLTERKLAQQALRHSEQRLRLAREVAAVGTFEWNIRDNVNVWSPEIERLYGLPEGGFGGTYEAWARCVHPDDLPTAEARVREAIETGGFEAEWRVVRPNGEVIWVQARGVVEKDAAGQPLRMIGANFDITERKKAEEAQALLMREVDHRAKNALAVVQSVVRLTRADNPADFVTVIEGRIGAIAHAHTLLAESGWQSASLRRLLRRELAAYECERVRIAGQDVVLRAEAAQPLALAIHELATNAAKYGALSTPSGRLDITWEKNSDTGVRIRWCERGGPTVLPPRRQSFGSTLITTAIEHQLGGAVRQDWNRDGLVCELTVPGQRVGQPAPPPRAAGRAPAEAARILIVEDDALIALDMVQNLAGLGYRAIGPVGRVADALRMIDLGAPDAVLLDANLANESARPVADRLRQLEIPFAIVTGYGRVAEIDPSDEVPLLTKPVGAGELRATLEGLTPVRVRHGAGAVGDIQ